MRRVLGNVLALVLSASVGWETAAAAACVDYAAEPKRLTDLESSATRGALDPAAIGCLEASYKATGEQVTKSKISRVLLVNAYATDTAAWAQLVQRHLDEVDQSDPDIAYLYAFYLYNHDTSSADVIRWSEVGLERKQVWTGNTHVSRVNGLLRLRTIAALKDWKVQALRATTDPAAQVAADEAKTRTKSYAREWLDFAREAGRDTTQPQEICLSAANAEACGLK